MNAIYQLLNPDNTISLNRPLAHAVGLMETVVYSALIAKWQYYSDRGKLDPDGWFYSTIADLEESTSLSDKQQKRCITVLEKRGLIKCSPRGMPQLLHNRRYSPPSRNSCGGRGKNEVRQTLCGRKIQAEFHHGRGKQHS